MIPHGLLMSDFTNHLILDHFLAHNNFLRHLKRWGFVLFCLKRKAAPLNCFHSIPTQCQEIFLQWIVIVK